MVSGDDMAVPPPTSPGLSVMLGTPASVAVSDVASTLALGTIMISSMGGWLGWLADTVAAVGGGGGLQSLLQLVVAQVSGSCFPVTLGVPALLVVAAVRFCGGCHDVKVTTWQSQLVMFMHHRHICTLHCIDHIVPMNAYTVSSTSCQ